MKAGGNLANSKLKGSISPEELLLATRIETESSLSFMETDPRDGFSVRNFQIQACKMATVSDIVVYGDDSTPREHVLNLAKKISQAQRNWREKQIAEGDEPLDFHTFVLSGMIRTSLSRLRL